ncbi:C45 family autoproteolytic acyltransferase/hydrolase [Alteribacillus sp. JSM 102045]|uniref:C45 family autoproteolytic acyltransferase/hydolase n=1 Tax=Alteribacillus sp. JSM 102045 TaxID=1562101 RepID=UPI0035C10E94
MKEIKPQEMLTLSGSSFDIGHQHGKEAKAKVHSSLETYERMFKEHTAISWGEACEKALTHLDAIEKLYPQYVEEMEGLAKGAGVSFEDVLALNARSEIALITAPDGCTSIAMSHPKTSKTWLAQNWDWKGTQLKSLVHVQIEQNDLPTIEMVTEAGIIGKIGCNSTGFGVCLNALVTDTWLPKIPIHLGLRAILDSFSFREALEKVENNQMASPAHFLVASKTGDMASLEVSPVRTEQITPTEGLLVHTNHLCSPEMREEMNEDILPDSYHRLSAINKHVGKLNNKEIEKEDVFHILSDHENYPNSICRHESSSQNLREKMENVFSIVMNLSDNELTWIHGNPCEHYQRG